METRYRKVKCSERLPKQEDVYFVEMKRADETPSYPAPLDFIPDNSDNVKLWEAGVNWWLEPIPPEAEEQHSQVGEEEIDKATTEYIESISDKDNRYINIQVNHVWAAAIKWYQSSYPTHPTAKKVPTESEIFEIIQGSFPDYNVPYCTEIAQDIHSLIPSQEVKNVPTDKDIEDWYLTSYDAVNDDKFWQEAPYCTHGDRLDEIKEALRHFSLLPDTIQNGRGGTERPIKPMDRFFPDL